MIYTLENEHLKLTFSNHGGEIHSITGKKDNTEYLWSGHESHWKYHAPILFPIVGKVIDGKYAVDGKTYELPQHGLARTREFNTVEQTENSIAFELKFSEETLEVYPYKFSLIIKYTLENNSVKIAYIVKNIDNKTIFFSIGAHPAFMCPILEDETMEDYYFEFNKKEKANAMELVDPGYYSGKRIPYLNNENIIAIEKDTFKNDALVFDNLSSNIVSLKSKNHSKSIEFDFTGFPYLALWSKAEGAPFVCIEPWFGHADFVNFNGDYSEKAGIQSLCIDEIFNCCHIVTIHQ